MSAFSSTIVALCSFMIPASAVSVPAAHAFAQETRPENIAADSSAAVDVSEGSSRRFRGSRNVQPPVWKQASSRGWTASASPRKTHRVQLVSATATEDSKPLQSPLASNTEPPSSTASEVGANSNSSAAAPPKAAGRKTAAAPAADEPAAESASVPDARPLTATEKFKRALAEQRRALEEQAARNESQDHALELPTPPTKPNRNPGLTATPNPDLLSDDPLKRETAERFQRLKEKLARLKLRVQNAETPQDLSQHNADSHVGSTDAMIPEADSESDHSAGDHSHEHATDHSSEHTNSDMSDEHPVAPEYGVASKDNHAPDASHSEPPAAHSDHADDDHQAEITEKHSNITEPVDSHASDDTQHGEGEHQAETPSSSSTPHSEHPHAEDTSVDSHEPGQEPGHESVTQTPVLFSDKAVVDGPIDRIGLANNLYAVGEYGLALDMYVHVKKKELTPEQQIWAEYQAANCLRRLGKNGEASNRYRRLAGMAEAGWLSDQSRWWLEVLEQVRQLEKSLQSDLDPPQKPAAGAHSETSEDTSAHGDAHQSGPHTDAAHKSPPQATKESDHGEHPE